MPNKMKSISEARIISVVGAGGFVGQHLVSYLLKKGNLLVHTLMRKPSLAKRTHCNLRPTIGDLFKDKELGDFLVPGCTVINLAYDFSATKDENIQAAVNLGRLCRNASIKRLVHCSTVSVFGVNTDEVVTEDSICDPKSDYGLAKLEIESVLHKASLCSFEFVILRPTSVFGPGGQALENIVDSFFSQNKILNYVKSSLFFDRKLNLVGVMTVVEAIIFLTEQKSIVNNEIFIISDDDEEINNYKYVRSLLYREITGRTDNFPIMRLPASILTFLLKLRRRDVYNPRKVYDASKIKHAGFLPSTTLDKQLRSFAAWHENKFLEKK